MAPSTCSTLFKIESDFNVQGTKNDERKDHVTIEKHNPGNSAGRGGLEFCAVNHLHFILLHRPNYVYTAKQMSTCLGILLSTPQCKTSNSRILLLSLSTLELNISSVRLFKAFRYSISWRI
jgi:hypothetical protein